MKISKESVLVIRNAQGALEAIVEFNGRQHTFHSTERMGMDQIADLLSAVAGGEANKKTV